MVLQSSLFVNPMVVLFYTKSTLLKFRCVLCDLTQHLICGTLSNLLYLTKKIPGFKPAKLNVLSVFSIRAGVQTPPFFPWPERKN